MATANGARIPQADQQIIAAYTAGQPVQACAAEFGVSAKTITRILDRHGIPRRPPGRPRIPATQTLTLTHPTSPTTGHTQLPPTGRSIDEAAVITAYADQQLSLRQCAAKFDVSTTLILRILDEHHIPRRTSALTPSEETALITAYTIEHLTLRQCAHRFNIATETAIRILRHHHIPRRQASRPTPLHNPATLAAFITTYTTQNLSIHECARRFGVRYSTARDALHANGIPITPPRSPGRPARPRANQAAVITAYTIQHLTLRECAHAFGISTTTVRKILRDNDIPSRPPGRPATRPSAIPTT